jgi:hypothetical protein
VARLISSFLLFFLNIFWSIESVLAAVIIKEGTNIKIEYIDPRVTKIGYPIKVQVDEDLFVEKKLLIRKGTYGLLKVTELEGKFQNKVKSMNGYVMAVNGQKIKIKVRRNLAHKSFPEVFEVDHNQVINL